MMMMMIMIRWDETISGKLEVLLIPNTHPNYWVENNWICLYPSHQQLNFGAPLFVFHLCLLFGSIEATSHEV